MSQGQTFASALAGGQSLFVALRRLAQEDRDRKLREAQLEQAALRDAQRNELELQIQDRLQRSQAFREGLDREIQDRLQRSQEFNQELDSAKLLDTRAESERKRRESEKQRLAQGALGRSLGVSLPLTDLSQLRSFPGGGFPDLMADPGALDPATFRAVIGPELDQQSELVQRQADDVRVAATMKSLEDDLAAVMRKREALEERLRGLNPRDIAFDAITAQRDALKVTEQDIMDRVRLARVAELSNRIGVPPATVERATRPPRERQDMSGRIEAENREREASILEGQARDARAFKATGPIIDPGTGEELDIDAASRRAVLLRGEALRLRRGEKDAAPSSAKQSQSPSQALIRKAFGNLVRAGNPSPTRDDIKAEIARIERTDK